MFCGNHSNRRGRESKVLKYKKYINYRYME